MSGFAILDLVIGIIFIYFLLSIMCSAILEIISNFMGMRANTLRRWFESTFDKTLQGQSLGQAILRHTLIYNLTKAGRKLSYVPKEEFSEALFDLIVKAHRQSAAPGAPVVQPYTGADIMGALQNQNLDLLPEDMRRILLQHITNTVSNTSNSSEVIKAVQSKMTDWYEKAQQRVTGWYKRRAQKLLLYIAVVVTVALNVDTISIAKHLYQNPAARTALAEAAAQALKDSSTVQMAKRYSSDPRVKMDTVIVEETVIDSAGRAQKVITKSVQPANVPDSVAIATLNENFKTVDTLYKQLYALHLPIGWSKGPDGEIACLKPGDSWPSKLAGWMITIMALSLGTPFWFDLLNKLVNLRGAGPAPNHKKVLPKAPDDKTEPDKTK
jgi:hypothetical protein